MSEEDSHYRTFPQGFSKREVNQLKRQALFNRRSRLDPTQEIDESQEEVKPEHGFSQKIKFSGKKEAAGSGGRQHRRNSLEGATGADAGVCDIDGGGDGGGGKSPKPRSGMKQLLFGSFRPRAKSETPESDRPGRGDKRRKASAGASSQPEPPADAGHGGEEADGEDGEEAGGQLGTIRQGEEYVHDSRRTRSPIGGLVTRLRQLATDDRRRRPSPGKPPVQGLPHPCDIPLDASFVPGARGFESVEDRRARMRKAISAETPATEGTHSDSGSLASMQDRHRDLFEASRKLSDSEGQLRAQPPASAMSELSSGRSRRLSGPQLRHHSAGSDVRVTENEKYIILQSKSPHDSSTSALQAVCEESATDPDRVFVIFSQKHRCYDLIPTSNKLLVFDQNLNVKKAFFALVYNGLRSAPVWDSENQKFVGMLTITDFINILHNYYKSALVPMDELESHRISTWRAQLRNRLKPFLWISPEASLLDAVKLLLHARVHRLPVVEPKTGNALFILTHKRILKYIYLFIHQLPMPEWMQSSLQELRIGTFADILTASETTQLVQVLGSFVKHRVSALPVVNEEGKLVDIYSKFDVINLAATKTYNNLDVSIKEALRYRSDRFEGVSTCRAGDSLGSVIEALVTAEVHRLVIVDSDNRVTGMVSLSDILKAIVIDRSVGSTSSVGEAASSDGEFASAEPMEMG